VQLSRHFALSEFTRTKARAPNVPEAHHVAAMEDLCVEVLEPWRREIGRIYVSSGFRSEAVNLELRELGYDTADNSEHCLGRAVDGKPLDLPIELAWTRLVRLAGGLPVGQAILYVRERGRGWIHVSHDPTEPRRRDLRIDPPSGRTIPWKDYSGPLVLPS
jgi:hypothetical protein